MKLLVFSSPDCAPCRAMHRLMDRYFEDYPQTKDNVEFLDISDEKDLEVADEYGVCAVPNLILVKDCAEMPFVLRRHLGGFQEGYEGLIEFIGGTL